MSDFDFSLLDPNDYVWKCEKCGTAMRYERLSRGVAKPVDAPHFHQVSWGDGDEDWTICGPVTPVMEDGSWSGSDKGAE